MTSTPVCSPDTRNRCLEALQTGVLDVLIVGGGINGAGVARDLALRAKLAAREFRVGLVEKGQFGSGTSGRNSHLVHGGLRYLKHLDFALVREALRERRVLMDIAAHLVEPLCFLMPFESRGAQVFYGAGLWLYDALAGKHQIGRHRSIPLRRLAELEPGMRSEIFVAAATFYDGRMQAARLVLENVWDAIGNGAAAANYVEVLEQSRGAGSIWQVRLRDRISGTEFTVRTRRIVDATGAWMQSEAVRLVRGSHLIFPRFNQSDNAVAYFEAGGRIVFFIPWGTGLQFTLVGTTDADHSTGADHVRISQEETAYLLSVTRHVFRQETVPEPLSSFSSLRPLVREEGQSATATSREHRIWADADGIVRIAGGKYTTYRVMSEEAVDLLVPEFKHSHPTADQPLNGNSPAAVRDLLDRVPEMAAAHGLTQEAVRDLVKNYGVQLPSLFGYSGDSPADAPIAYAARHEMAQSLHDLLFVSTTWGYEQRWDLTAMRGYAEALGRHLGWNESRVESEAETTLQFCLESAPFASSSIESTSAT